MIFLNGHVNRGKWVVDVFDSSHVVGHRHVPLSDIAQLLSELQLLGCGACGENLLQVSPSFLQRLGVPDMAQQHISDTGGKTIHNSTYRLFPSWEVLVCRIRCRIVGSVDITPVTMPEQVLVHLVRPRCIVGSVKLPHREQASHSLIHIFLLFVLYRVLGFVFRKLLSTAEVLNPHALIPCKRIQLRKLRKNQLVWMAKECMHKFNGNLTLERQS